MDNLSIETLGSHVWKGCQSHTVSIPPKFFQAFSTNTDTTQQQGTQTAPGSAFLLGTASSNCKKGFLKNLKSVSWHLDLF